MKKILVNGYFGVNFGDDLFFKILFERYPEVKFEFYNNSYFQQLYGKYVEIYSNNKNVQVRKYNKLRKIFQKIGNTKLIDRIQYKDYDASVFIGGSIFMETPLWRYSYMEKENIINYFYDSQKPVYIIGSNFGPVNTDEFKIKYNYLFNKCEDICFRDKYSFNIFDGNNIRVAPDVVFQLKATGIDKVKNSIGISVINTNNKSDLRIYEKAYNKKIKELVETFIELGKTVTFFSFCESEGDMEAINKIIALVDIKYLNSIRIQNYTGNIENFLIEFESMESIVGTRFHACILSQVFNQGLYPLIYSDKTYNVLKDISLDKHYKYIKDIEDLNIKTVIDTIENNKIENKEIFKEAEKQFKGLDKYVRG